MRWPDERGLIVEAWTHDTLAPMEIHAPDKPVHGWKDFVVHIAIVTVGILIALGLDGLREHFRERRLVHETREAVHYEIEADDGHMAEEMRKVTAFRDAMKQIVDGLPGNAQADPAQMIRQLNGLYNPGYFLAANSWQAALSTGALAHMKTDEVAAYAYAAEGIARYSALQTSAEHEEVATKAFFMAYPQPTGPQLAEGVQHLMLLYRAEDALAFVGPQVKDAMDRALRASQ